MTEYLKSLESAELSDAENRIRTKYMKRRFKIEETNCLLPSEERNPFYGVEEQDYFDGHLCLESVPETIDKRNAKLAKEMKRELKLEEARSPIPWDRG